jgi:hypothetical protein
MSGSLLPWDIPWLLIIFCKKRPTSWRCRVYKRKEKRLLNMAGYCTYHWITLSLLQILHQQHISFTGENNKHGFQLQQEQRAKTALQQRIC